MIILGIDGGGTKTEVLAVDERARVLGLWRGAGTNLHRLGMDGVEDVVLARVHEVLGAHEKDVLIAACLAGIDTASMQARLREGLTQREPRWAWIVENDAVAAWWGAFLGRPGVVTIAGTGAVAYANSGTRVARAGGWGALLGDEGSAYSLGRAAIIAVLRAQDGMGPETRLRHAVLESLGLSQTQDLIDHVHLAMSHADVASLAPSVVAVASNGDAVAQRLLEAAAVSLVELAQAVATRVATAESRRLDAAFVGGLARVPQVRGLVEERLADSSVCRWHEPIARAVVGAVVLGASSSGCLAGWDGPRVAELIRATEEL